MKIEEYLEDAAKDLMEARSGVIALSYGVFKYKDYEQFRGDQSFLVKAAPHRRIAPNFHSYEVRLSAMVMSKRDEDQKGKDLDAGVGECNDFIEQELGQLNGGIATLQAAVDAAHPSSGITIEGILQQEGETQGEIIFGQGASALIYLKYIKPVTT